MKKLDIEWYTHREIRHGRIMKILDITKIMKAPTWCHGFLLLEVIVGALPEVEVHKVTFE
jgi:hypothetical protein